MNRFRNLLGMDPKQIEEAIEEVESAIEEAEESEDTSTELIQELVERAEALEGHPAYEQLDEMVEEIGGNIEMPTIGELLAYAKKLRRNEEKGLGAPKAMFEGDPMEDDLWEVVKKLKMSLRRSADSRARAKKAAEKKLDKLVADEDKILIGRLEAGIEAAEEWMDQELSETARLQRRRNLNRGIARKARLKRQTRRDASGGGFFPSSDSYEESMSEMQETLREFRKMLKKMED